MITVEITIEPRNPGYGVHLQTPWGRSGPWFATTDHGAVQQAITLEKAWTEAGYAVDIRRPALGVDDSPTCHACGADVVVTTLGRMHVDPDMRPDYWHPAR